MRIVLLSLAILLCTTPAFARLDSFVFECLKLPTIPINATIPDVSQFNRTNNLRRETGSAEIAEGEPIILSGIISDKNCIPLEGAEVYIWHKDAEGNNPLAEPVDENLDPNFIGTGLSITSNLGRYHFLTVEPGVKEEGATPHINLYITHPLLEDGVFVPVYFPERESNTTDPTYQSFSQPHQQILTSSLKESLHKGMDKNKFKDDVYQFNIRVEVEQSGKVY